MNELKPEDVMGVIECRKCDYATVCKSRSMIGDLLREKDAEIERLTEENKSLHDNTEVIIEMVTIARSEAITEFAERIKATFPAKNDARCTLDDCYTLDKIDEIAKEMEGEDGTD